MIFDKTDSIDEFLKNNEDINSERSEDCDTDHQESDGCEDEIVLQDLIDRGKIKLFQSSTSCSLEDI